MNKLSWIFELIDRVSGPANAAQKSIDRVSSSMRSASSSSDSFAARVRNAGSAFSRFTFAVLPTIVALGQIASAGIAVSNIMKIMGVNASTLRAGFAAIRGGVSRALASLRQFALRAVAYLRQIPPHVYMVTGAVVGMGVAAWGVKRAVSAILSPFRQLGSMALSAAPFVAIAGALSIAKQQIEAIVARQRMVRGFDVMLGAENGDRVMRRVVALSDQLGVSWNETGGAVRELFSKGFGEERVFQLVQGFADLRAVNPDASLDRIALAMGQVRQAGRLQGDELNQLAEGGLNLSRVMPRIAAALNIDPTKVRDAMRAGLITADIFENAVLGAMSEQAGGTIGSIAEDMSHTLGGEIERLQNLPGQFFERVAANGGAVTEQLTGAVRRMNELLNPSSETGQKIIRGLTQAIEGAANALTWATTHTEEFERVATGLGIVLTPIRWALSGFVTILGAVADLAELVSLGIDSIVSRGRAMSVMFNVEILTTMNDVKARMLTFGAELFTIGQNMIMGLVNGLMSMITVPASIISTMGSDMLTSLRTALGIHSPSREFAYLGEMSGAGFMAGLASSGMGTSLSGEIQAPESAANVSTMTGGNTINLTIQVDAGNADAREMADMIGDVVMSRLSLAFDSLTLEAGV